MKNSCLKNTYVYHLILLLTLFSFITVKGQGKYCVDEIRSLNLDSAKGSINTYYSKTAGIRALELRQLLQRAAIPMGDSLGVKLDLSLALLDKEQWKQVMDKTYGLPTVRSGACKRGGGSFTKPRYIAIMPAAINGAAVDSWNILRDSLSSLSTKRLKDAGLTFEQGGKVLLDFIAIHELGHAYAMEFGIKNYVNLFAELMANYMAYAFLRSTEERLDKKVMAVLQTNIETIRPIHKSFLQWEKFRSSEHPPTEAWYNSIVTMKAAEIFEMRGYEFLHAVRKAFPEQEGELNTETILKRLDTIYPGILQWAERIAKIGK